MRLNMRVAAAIYCNGATRLRQRSSAGCQQDGQYHMTGPVEVASDLSAFQAARVGDHAVHGGLLEGAAGAAARVWL